MCQRCYDKKCIRNPCNCNNRSKCCEKTLCGKKISKTGIIISKPGTYYLKGDVEYSPLVAKTSAIVIDSDNVVLNLCGNVVKQLNTIRQTIGIKVKTGHCNVKIFNGTIQDFSMKGLEVEGNTEALILGEDGTFLKVLGCGKGSTFAFFDQVSQESILQNGIQLGITRLDETKGFGTYLGPISNVRITNVLCKKNSPIGMYMGEVKQMTVKHSSFSQTEGFRPAGVSSGTFTAYGLAYLGVEKLGDKLSDISFQSCNFDENLIKEDPENLFGRLDSNVCGFFGGISWTNLEFVDCTFNQNRNEAISFRSIGTGPFFSGGGDYYSFRNCVIADNYSRSNLECHVSASLSGLIEPTGVMEVLDCTFVRNISESPGFGVVPSTLGLNLVFNNSARVEGCIFTDNKAIVLEDEVETQSAIVTGIALIGSSTLSPDSEQQNTLISKNIFAQNSTNSRVSSTDVSGIVVDIATENVNIKDNYISQNRDLGNSGDASVNGILIKGSIPVAEVTVGGKTYSGNFTLDGPSTTWPDPTFTAPGQETDPVGACSGPLVDLTGKIGIIDFDKCVAPSSTRVLNVESAGGVGTLIISEDEITDNYGGSSSQEHPAVVVSNSDGQDILAYISENPDSDITFITLDSPRTGIIVQGNTIQDHPTAGVSDRLGFEDTICDNIIDRCGAGVLLASRARCNSVQGNKISNASVVGIRDEAEESTNLVIKNQVWNSASGIEVEYASGPAPTKTGSLATGLPSDVAMLDNVVITKGNGVRNLSKEKESKSLITTKAIPTVLAPVLQEALNKRSGTIFSYGIDQMIQKKK